MKFSTFFSSATLIAAASLAIAAALPFDACAQDYRGMLNQQWRTGDDLNRQMLETLQRVADPALKEAIRQRMQEPMVRAEYHLHVRQMRDAGRVPLGFTHFVFNRLRNHSADQRDDPREREVTKSPPPGESDRTDLSP